MTPKGGSGLRQIPLDLTPVPDFTYESFIEAPSNQAALKLMRQWPNWPAPAILLLGPSGTGKTHLGQAWQAQSGGVFLDDAHQETEDGLFGAINRALRSEVPAVLLASDRSPAEWGVMLPDLRSRLAAMPVFQLHEPDDESLRPITRALFQRQGRTVSRDVVDYLLKYTDRSVPALRVLISTIDAAASSDKVDVTRPFVAKIVRQSFSDMEEE